MAVGVILLLLPIAGCTGGHAHGDATAAGICDTHFKHATAAEDRTVATSIAIGGPALAHPEKVPIAKYPAADRVVRCLVPTSADSAEVWDIVVSFDKKFQRWTQSGDRATIAFEPPS